VPREKLELTEQIAKQAAESFTQRSLCLVHATRPPRVGRAPATVRELVEKGLAEDAKLVTGGTELPDGLERGYFVKPTVFSNASTDMTIAQEEVFGRVLPIIAVGFKNWARTAICA
jgi:aldehyde dehydrogenase (NAD+)